MSVPASVVQNSALSDAQFWLALSMLVSVVVFPLLHWAWRNRNNPPNGAPTTFDRADAIKMVWAGASAPQAICIILLPVFPPIAKTISEAPLLFIPTGLIALVIFIGDIFDWR